MTGRVAFGLAVFVPNGIDRFVRLAATQPAKLPATQDFLSNGVLAMKMTHLAGIALLAVVSTAPAFGQTQAQFVQEGGPAYDPAAAVYAPQVPQLAGALQSAAAPAPAVKPDAEAVPPAPPPPAPAAAPAPAVQAEVKAPPAPAAKVPPPPAPPAEAKPAPPAVPAQAAPPAPAAPAVPPAPKPDNGITSPSDAPPPVVAAPKVQLEQRPETPGRIKDIREGKVESCSEDDCTCGRFGGWLACNPREAWKLPQPCWLQEHKMVLGGWLQQGITVNNQNSDGFNGPVATNDLAGEYQMNQMWLYLHRPADNGGCGFAWGGHIDIMYGTDGRFGINKGLEDRIYGFNRETYGIVIPQFYLELAFNDLSVKLGHFAGILDYEAIPGPMNPFYSHSYSYGYTVPQLVTGFLLDYKLNDEWSVQGGVHRGWMQFEDYNDDLDVMAGIKWQSCDKKTEVRYALSSGRQSSPFDDDNRFVSSFVLTHQLTEPLKYVLVQNVGVEKSPLGDGGSAQWYGVNQYLLYTINKCWSANLRAEWMRDDDGLRIAGPGNVPGIRAWDGAGYAGDFYEISAGLNWRPTGNWLVRPEVRWDVYDGPESPKPGNALPFGQGTSDDQLTFAVDAIFSF